MELPSEDPEFVRRVRERISLVQRNATLIVQHPPVTPPLRLSRKLNRADQLAVAKVVQDAASKKALEVYNFMLDDIVDAVTDLEDLRRRIREAEADAAARFAGRGP